MKALKIITGILFIASIWGCIGDNKSNTNHIDSLSNQPIEDSLSHIPTPILWTYDAAADSMIQNTIPSDISIDLVMNELNGRYKKVKIDYLKTSIDTVYLKIDDVSYLGQLGSSGNYGFLAEVVYSLTEVPDVNYIYLDFDEVDHATPGLYTRKDFNNKL